MRFQNPFGGEEGEKIPEEQSEMRSMYKMEKLACLEWKVKGREGLGIKLRSLP